VPRLVVHTATRALPEVSIRRIESSNHYGSMMKLIKSPQNRNIRADGHTLADSCTNQCSSTEVSYIRSNTALRIPHRGRSRSTSNSTSEAPTTPETHAIKTCHDETHTILHGNCNIMKTKSDVLHTRRVSADTKRIRWQHIRYSCFLPHDYYQDKTLE
jgi:hypothetical protein